MNTSTRLYAPSATYKAVLVESVFIASPDGRPMFCWLGFCVGGPKLSCPRTRLACSDAPAPKGLAKRNTRPLLVSATYKLPLGSTSRAVGPFKPVLPGFDPRHGKLLLLGTQPLG